MFKSTKTFGHDLGLSACFRQWRATHSHCSKLHGYALSFRVTFGGETLDDKNWVQDFGGLKHLKQYLQDTFDHKLVVAEDDPQKQHVLNLDTRGLADVLVLSAVGCEAFAQNVFTCASLLYNDDRVRVLSVECAEHGANSAIYEG